MKSLILEKGPLFRRRALLFLIAVAPVLILRMLNDPINVPKLALVAIVVALVGAVRILEVSQGAPAEGLKRLLIPAVGVLVPLTIAWAASPYRYWALFGQYRRFEGLIPYIVIVLVGILIADAFGGRTREIAWALVLGAAAVGGYALIQFAGLDPLEWQAAGEGQAQATGTLGNPNFLGGFLGICIGPVAALWAADPPRRNWVIAVGVLIGGGLLVSFSQGGWAAGAAGFAVVLGALVRPRWGPARLAGLLAALFISLLAIGQVLLGVVDPTNPLVPGTVRLRSDAWKGAITMTARYPLAGRGPNAYAVEGVRHRTLQDALRIGYNYPDDPHSVTLAFATAAGLLGVVGLFVAFGWLLREGLRGPPDDVLLAGFLGGLIAYLVQASVSVDTVTLRLAAWIVAGGMIATLHQRSADPVRSRRRRKRKGPEPLARLPLVLLTLALALGSVGWTSGYVWADAQVWNGTTHAANRRPLEARAAYERALGFKGDYEYRRMFGLVVGRIAVASGDRDAFEAARDAFAYLESFPQVSRLAELGRFLDSWGEIDEEGDEQALSVFQRMNELDPLNPLIEVEMASVLIDLDRAPEAVSLLEPLIDLADRAAPKARAGFWGQLALARARSGDEAGAEEAIDEALSDNPEDPAALEARELLEGEQQE